MPKVEKQREVSKIMIRRNILIIIVLFSTLLYGETYQTHNVKAGETLWRISQNYNIPIEKICSINNIKSPEQVYKGMNLKIPKNKEVKYKNHIVQKGENLFRIGLIYNITVTKICEINNFQPDVRLFEGMKIKVPDFENEVIYTSNNKSISAENIKTSKYRHYYVDKGDTLWSISRKFNISVDIINSLNNFTANSKIKIGDKIKLPEYSDKNYVNFNLPLAGDIKPLVKTHFKGIIIFSNTTNSIKAPQSGTVVFVGQQAGYGKVVFLKHRDEILSVFSGFDNVYVKKGQTIKKGEIIGKSGDISRYEKKGILFSLQKKGEPLKFDMLVKKFYIN